MKIINSLCILLIMNSVFSFTFLIASDYNSMTLRQCIDLALENNQSIKIQKGYEAVQNTRIKQNKSYLFPRVYNSYNFTRDWYKRKYNGQSSDSYGSYLNAYLNVDYNILDISNFLYVKSSKKRLQYYKYNIKNYERNVKLSTSQTFYEAFEIQEIIPYYDTELNVYKDLLNFIESNNLSEYDKTFIIIEIERLKSEIERMEIDYSRSKHYLKRIIGIDDINIKNLKANVEFDPIRINVDDNIEKYINQRPDMLAAKALKLTYKIDVKMSYSDMLPTIGFGGSTSYYESYGNYESIRNSWNIGAGLYVPIFQGFRKRHKIEEAKIFVKTQENSIKDVEQCAIYEIRNAYHILTRIEKEYLSNELIIEKAKNKYNMSIDRYKKGIGNLIEVRDALCTYYGAQINRLNLLISYKSSVANFNWAIGEI